MSTATLKRPRFGSLFSGIGGLDLAVEEFFDADIAWHAEFDPEPSKVLEARWPGVPNLGDVTTVDWTNVETVDGLCGGFPCQDLSLAGRHAGMRPGTRSGLWADFKAAIAALRPSVVVIENVRGLLSGCAESDSDMEPCPGCLGVSKQHRPLVRALGRVLGDLAELGFDAEWEAVRASDVGAPHGRFRVFVVAYRRGEAREFWPGLRAGEPRRFGWGRPNHDAVQGRDDLALLPTITASESDKGGPNQAHGSGDRTLSGTVTLFRTPAAAELEGGRRNPDRAASTMRLRDQVAEAQERGLLLPTPVAQPSGNTPQQHLRKKPGRQIVTDLAILTENDLLASGGRLLPTVVGTDATGSRRHSTQTGVMHSGTSLSDALLPTPTTAYASGGNAVRGGDRSDERLLPGIACDVTAAGLNWGPYEPAVRLWESQTRVAPAPTLPDGKDSRHRLSSLFTEWMMGYSRGWVTDILDRNAAIKACGNGVVPQQAVLALSLLWPRILESLGRAA